MTETAARFNLIEKIRQILRETNTPSTETDQHDPHRLPRRSTYHDEYHTDKKKGTGD